MGGRYSQDKNIDLYMVVNKQYYIAGDYIQGQVFLNAKAQSKYKNICLKIYGQQYVYWTKGTGEFRQTYENRYTSYKDEILLMDFNEKVEQGQYCFPFTFLLPSLMAGSFYHSKECYIRYILRVQLMHSTEQKKSQIYDMFLNILEAPPKLLQSRTKSNSVVAKCCGNVDWSLQCCCLSYGTASCTLTCSKNFVVNGEQVEISGLIDNNLGKTAIKQFRISLKEIRLMIFPGGVTYRVTDKIYPLLESKVKIRPGCQQNFNFKIKIPEDIFHYTAIGRILGRFFILFLETNYGCCADTAWTGVHLLINSKTPMVVAKKEIPPPQGWYPQTYPKVNCQALKPYIYNPFPNIEFLILPNSEKNNLKTPQPQKQNLPIKPREQKNQIQSNQIILSYPYLPGFSNNEAYFSNQYLSSPIIDQQHQAQKVQQPIFTNPTSTNLVSKSSLW